MRVAAGLLCVLALAGCSQKQGNVSAQPEAPNTAAPTCAASQLSTTVTVSLSAGTVNGMITYTGKGCTLVGYPGLVLDTSNGADTAEQIPSTTTGVSPTVTLDAKTSAYATFSWMTKPPTGSPACATLQQIRLTAPTQVKTLPDDVKGAAVCTTPLVGPLTKKIAP